MSTSYVSKEPMRMSRFLFLAQEVGWKVHRVDADKGFDVILTDGTNYAHCYDGYSHISVDRFGGNRVEALVDHVDMWSEYDEEFEAVCEGQTEIED